MAEWLAAQLGVPLCPVGSRSVALEMGLVGDDGKPDPYLADKRGVRREFQERLIASKTAWEREHASFVTDRTTLDNAAYSILHGAGGISASYLRAAVAGMQRYDVVFYCPTETFIKIGGDGARVGGKGEVSEEDARAYHDVYNQLIFALLLKHYPAMTVLAVDGIEDRKRVISQRLRLA
jgi:hypothetical protein